MLEILLDSFLFACIIYSVVFFGRGNFYPVTPFEAYRSAQLNRKMLTKYINEYKIKSVLNLRGLVTDDKKYMDELYVCKKYGIKHFDIALSATNEPAEEQISMLMKIFKQAPRPVLIHCKAGADRSGLVSAMWKVSVDGESKRKASDELSILYGHIPFGRRRAMDDFFKKWKPIRIK